MLLTMHSSALSFFVHPVIVRATNPNLKQLLTLSPPTVMQFSTMMQFPFTSRRHEKRLSRPKSTLLRALMHAGICETVESKQKVVQHPINQSMFYFMSVHSKHDIRQKRKRKKINWQPARLVLQVLVLSAPYKQMERTLPFLT